MWSTSKRPYHWTGDGHPASLVPVSPLSPEAAAISQYFYEPMPDGTELCKIERWESRKLMIPYLAYRETVRTELSWKVDEVESWLFHGTDSIDDVLESGFCSAHINLRRNYYGAGHYFARDPRLSHFFVRGQRQHSVGSEVKILLCRVVVGWCAYRDPIKHNAHELRKPENRKPPDGYQSVTSSDMRGREIVVFPGSPSTPAYPAYVLTFKTPFQMNPYDGRIHLFTMDLGFREDSHVFNRYRKNYRPQWGSPCHHSGTANPQEFQQLEEVNVNVAQSILVRMCQLKKSNESLSKATTEAKLEIDRLSKDLQSREVAISKLEASEELRVKELQHIVNVVVPQITRLLTGTSCLDENAVKRTTAWSEQACDGMMQALIARLAQQLKIIENKIEFGNVRQETDRANHCESELPDNISSADGNVNGGSASCDQARQKRSPVLGPVRKQYEVSLKKMAEAIEAWQAQYREKPVYKNPHGTRCDKKRVAEASSSAPENAKNEQSMPTGEQGQKRPLNEPDAPSNSRPRQREVVVVEDDENEEIEKADPAGVLAAMAYHPRSIQEWHRVQDLIFAGHDPLPEGWIRVWSRRSNCVYYVRMSDKKTVWKLESIESSSVPENAKNEQSRPTGGQGQIE